MKISSIIKRIKRFKHKRESNTFFDEFFKEIKTKFNVAATKVILLDRQINSLIYDS